MANQIYPVLFTTKPQPTDIPAPSSFLPTGYKLGQAYDGSAVVQKNNPLFVNFPLPYVASKKVADVSFQGAGISGYSRPHPPSAKVRRPLVH